MYNWDNYDNDIAYGYDEYLEELEGYDDVDRIIEEQYLDSLEYQEKMVQDMIDKIYE